VVQTINIDLAYETFTGGSPNDLDLYAFGDQGGSLRFLAASTREPGEPEGFFGWPGAGIYYFAVQAWDTPTGRAHASSSNREEV
jgi:hypothetical protein